MFTRPGNCSIPLDTEMLTMWGADPELQAGQPSPPATLPTTRLTISLVQLKKTSSGWWLSPTPLKNMKVHWKDYPIYIYIYMYIMENKKCSKPPTSHETKKNVAACSVRTSSGFIRLFKDVPSGKRLHNYGKSSCLMGKSTPMAIFHSQLLNYQRVYPIKSH